MVALRTYTAYPVKMIVKRRNECFVHSGICIDGLGCVALPAVANICKWRPFGLLTPEFEVTPVFDCPNTYEIRSLDFIVRFDTPHGIEATDGRVLRYRSVYTDEREETLRKIGTSCR